MDTQSAQSSLFATLSPSKLFFHCALPSMASMAFSSLYTVADGVFVGRFLGDRALAAVNLVMPFIMISFALADMIAVGSSVQIGIRMGRGEHEEASRIFSFSCGMILLLSVLVGGAGFVLAEPLVSLLGADAEVALLAARYMRVYALFSPLIMCFFAVDNYLRLCGRVRYSMWMNIVISLSNIALDALFLGVFHWGIASAAVASCLCLAMGSVICFWPFLRGRLPLRFVRARIAPHIVRSIVANGSSEFFSNIASSVCMVLFNAVLLRLSGYLAVAAFSIVLYVDSVVKSILFGMSDALQPALSYNYGAGAHHRLFAIERRVLIAAACVSIGALALMLLGGAPLIGLFTEPGNPALLALSTRAMHLFALSYLVSWCGIAGSSFLTAVDRPAASFALSICQTLLLPLLALAALSQLWGLDGVWLSSLAAGSVSALLAVLLIARTVRRMTATHSAP